MIDPHRPQTRRTIYQNIEKPWVYSYFAVKLKCKHVQKGTDSFFRTDRDTTFEGLQVLRTRNFKIEFWSIKSKAFLF